MSSKCHSPMAVFNIMNRWLLSTDARDIGVLYLILSIFSGMVGSGFSFLIRLQLMDVNQNAVLNISGQTYNSIITIHAILMIFFLVMPAMFSAFGNLFLPTLVGALDMANHQDKSNINTNTNSLNYDSFKFYFTGL